MKPYVVGGITHATGQVLQLPLIIDQGEEDNNEEHDNKDENGENTENTVTEDCENNKDKNGENTVTEDCENKDKNGENTENTVTEDCEEEEEENEDEGTVESSQQEISGRPKRACRKDAGKVIESKQIPKKMAKINPKKVVKKRAQNLRLSRKYRPVGEEEQEEKEDEEMVVETLEEFEMLAADKSNAQRTSTPEKEIQDEHNDLGEQHVSEADLFNESFLKEIAAAETVTQQDQNDPKDPSVIKKLMKRIRSLEDIQKDFIAQYNEDQTEKSRLQKALIKCSKRKSH
jgi:hypothetical protein